MQCASWSSGRVRLSEPRNDFANGVRELATTTASLMVFPYEDCYPQSAQRSQRNNNDLRALCALCGYSSYFSLSKSAKVLPASARRFNKGAGSHNSPCSLWNWPTRSYTFFNPTVSAYHIGPPRQAG